MIEIAIFCYYSWICLDLTPSLEQCPKWQALSEILAEISEEEDVCCEIDSPDSSEDRDGLQNGARVLICAEDDRTCSQIKSVSFEMWQECVSNILNSYEKICVKLFENLIKSYMTDIEP